MFEHPTHPKDQWAFAGLFAVFGSCMASTASVGKAIPNWEAVVGALVVLFIGTPMIGCVLAVCRDHVPRLGRAFRLFIGSGQVGAAGTIAALLKRDDLPPGFRWQLVLVYSVIAISCFTGARFVDESRETPSDSHIGQ